METTDDIDLGAVAEYAEGLSGAEVEAVCTEAGYTAIRDDRERVTQQDLVDAVEEIRGEIDASGAGNWYVY